MIEELIADIESSIEDINKKFYGVVVGRVIDPLDPMMLGRVQVQLPFNDALDLSPWARVCTPMAGMFCGQYMLPNFNDEVLVAFENGDMRAPYVLGTLWSLQALPPLPSPIPQIRATRTLVGNQIVTTEVPPSITIQNGPTPPEVLPAPPLPTAPYNTVSLNPAGVQVMSATMVTIQVTPTTTVAVTAGGVIVTAGSTTLAVTPAGISMSGPTITIAAEGPLQLVGNPVMIN